VIKPSDFLWGVGWECQEREKRKEKGLMRRQKEGVSSKFGRK
jgi:hypothetical protein